MAALRPWVAAAPHTARPCAPVLHFSRPISSCRCTPVRLGSTGQLWHHARLQQRQQRWQQASRIVTSAAAGKVAAAGDAGEGETSTAASSSPDSSSSSKPESAAAAANEDSGEDAAAAGSARVPAAVAAAASTSASPPPPDQPQPQQQSQQQPAWLAEESPWLTALRVGSDAAATAAATPAGAAGSTAAASSAATSRGTGASALGALVIFFKVLGDTLRVLLRLLLVEPLSWLLNRSGLLAIRAADVVVQLERANKVSPLEPERLAAALALLNKNHPQSVVEFVEANCLSGSQGQQAAEKGAAFAVNAAVVREYITALVQTGRLSQYGDSPDAVLEEGQSHRSLPRLLEELQAAAGGAALTAMPGASIARPLHIVMQGQAKPGGLLSWLSSFMWSCLGVMAVMYVMTAGASAMRRLQGGPAVQAGMPGSGAGVTAASNGSSMFAAKEYSKENLPEKSLKKFKDVKGCDEAIAELKEIADYLKSPDKYTRLGGKLPKGVLLTGPPGTGKTLLARAVAGEAGVPFFYKAGSEFDEMFVGVGSRRVRSLFAAAKKKAPCIIFIDEIDAMGGKRTNWESSGGSRKTLNQLLTDMDGFEENNGVVVMAATNLPELLDSALTRPGRFDRQVAVTLPDVRGRKQILELYLEGKPVSADVDTEMLARRTPGFSGAELANLVNESALLAARHDKDAVSAQLLDEARDKILMGTPCIIEQSEEARTLTAYHEGGHALVALYTAGAKPIHKATIVPRGHALGMVSQVPDKDEYSTTRQQMQAHIDVCMGGKAAEELIFGGDHVTSGATSDLKQATRMARHMVVDCGMSDRIGPVAVGEEQSPSTRQAVDDEVQGMLKAAYRRVVSLLKEKEAELHRLAQALLKEETLSLAEIKSLLLVADGVELPGGPSGPGSSGGSGSGGGGGIGSPSWHGGNGGEAAVGAPAPAAAAAAAAASSVASSAAAAGGGPSSAA